MLTLTLQLSIVILTAVCVNTSPHDKTKRIVNGEESTPHAFPWQALFINFQLKRPFCAGSLVNHEWIVTAAHCFQDVSPFECWVILGEHDYHVPDKFTQSFWIDQYEVHPFFDRATVNNDIALVKILGKVTFTNQVLPIALPYHLSHLPDFSRVSVSGWGETSYGGPVSHVLRKTELRYFSSQKCKAVKVENFGSKITDNMICAVNRRKDACRGDSGGGLIWENTPTRQKYLVGVVSFGSGCARTYLPGVYANILKFLSSFIDPIIWS